MCYKLFVDDYKEIIRLKVVTVLSQEQRVRILTSILNLVTEYGYNKILMDMSESGVDSDEPVTNVFELVDFMHRLGFKPETKMAFVYSSGEMHRKIFETAACLQRLKIKYFKSFDEAERWLHYEL